MCGIAGIVRWGRVERDPLLEEIGRMTRAIAHRGPDDEQLHVEGPVALGFRRLAIIDPDGGRQPMASEDGSVVLVCNGEIYNFRELRDVLAGLGHDFRTRCDCEVIVHAYEQWGTQCLQRLRGMFAFAIVDFRRRTVLLARDHFGIKPLCYRVGQDFFAFASELSALRQVDAEVPRGDLLSIELYLRYQYIPTPRTIYRDVHKLPPASFMEIGFDGTHQAPQRYWRLRFEPAAADGDGWHEQAGAVLRESVTTHLVSDVPLGVFCSGGIDSALVAMAMSEVLEEPVKAFAIGFDEAAYSELKWAEQVARRFGLDLTTAIIGADSLDMLPQLVAHYGEPFGDSSAIPTWHVARLARGSVPMVLSGDGGDEAFGGYASYAEWMDMTTWSRALRLVPHARRQAVRQLLRRARMTLRAGPSIDDWLDIMAMIPARGRRRLWKPAYRDLVDRPCDLFRAAAAEAPADDRLAFAQYVDYQTYLPCDILTKVDIAAMCHGLEVRTPLVDMRVLDLARRLPPAQRFTRAGTGRAIGKPLLRGLLAGRLPAELVNRPKQGFAIPRDRWFMPGQSARALFEQVVFDGSLRDWFDMGAVRRLLLSHGPGRDHSNGLWMLLVLAIWLDQNPRVVFA